jgi:hypothetical protein
MKKKTPTLTKLSSKEVYALLDTKTNVYEKAIEELNHAEGILVSRREFMRTYRIGKVREISAKIKIIANKLNCKLGVKQVGMKTLIFKKVVAMRKDLSRRKFTKSVNFAGKKNNLQK